MGNIDQIDQLPIPMLNCSSDDELPRAGQSDPIGQDPSPSFPVDISSHEIEELGGSDDDHSRDAGSLGGGEFSDMSHSLDQELENEEFSDDDNNPGRTKVKDFVLSGFYDNTFKRTKPSWIIFPQNWGICYDNLGNATHVRRGLEALVPIHEITIRYDPISNQPTHYKYDRAASGSDLKPTKVQPPQHAINKVAFNTYWDALAANKQELLNEMGPSTGNACLRNKWIVGPWLQDTLAAAALGTDLKLWKRTLNGSTDFSSSSLFVAFTQTNEGLDSLHNCLWADIIRGDVGSALLKSSCLPILNKSLREDDFNARRKLGLHLHFRQYMESLTYLWSTEVERMTLGQNPRPSTAKLVQATAGAVRLLDHETIDKWRSFFKARLSLRRALFTHHSSHWFAFELLESTPISTDLFDISLVDKGKAEFSSWGTHSWDMFGAGSRSYPKRTSGSGYKNKRSSRSSRISSSHNTRGISTPSFSHSAPSEAPQQLLEPPFSARGGFQQQKRRRGSRSARGRSGRAQWARGSSH